MRPGSGREMSAQQLPRCACASVIIRSSSSVHVLFLAFGSTNWFKQYPSQLQSKMESRSHTNLPINNNLSLLPVPALSVFASWQLFGNQRPLNAITVLLPLLLQQTCQQFIFLNRVFSKNEIELESLNETLMKLNDEAPNLRRPTMLQAAALEQMPAICTLSFCAAG